MIPPSLQNFSTTLRPTEASTTVSTTPLAVVSFADVQQTLSSIDVSALSFQVDTNQFHGPMPDSGNLADLMGGVVDEDIQDMPESESLGDFLQNQNRKKRSVLERGLDLLQRV